MITSNLKDPIDVDGVKGRIQQKLLRIMSSVQLSNDITSLKQLDKSLNAAENLFISLNKSKSLTHLHTVTNAPANKKIDVQKKFYSTTKKRKRKQKIRYARPTEDEKQELFNVHHPNTSYPTALVPLNTKGNSKSLMPNFFT